MTKNRKIVHSKAYKSHILTKKSTKRKRGLRKKETIKDSDYSRIKKMLPYEF